MTVLLALDDPPPYSVLNPDGTSPFVLLCEHALPRIPRTLGDLGLTKADRLRHIGWDIGAADVAQQLAADLDATLFMAGYSRLVVDCNRPLNNPSRMPEISENTQVPGNIGLPSTARATRLGTLFHPLHNAVARRLDLQRAARMQTFVVGVHSYSPAYKGVARPGMRAFFMRVLWGLRRRY